MTTYLFYACLSSGQKGPAFLLYEPQRISQTSMLISVWRTILEEIKIETEESTAFKNRKDGTHTRTHLLRRLLPKAMGSGTCEAEHWQLTLLRRKIELWQIVCVKMCDVINI